MRSRLILFWAPRRSSGFSLLEVMVALAIMAVALVSVFQLFSLTLRSVKKSEDYTKALYYARSLLDEALVIKDIEENSDVFEYEDFYKATREIHLSTESEDKKTKQYRIDVAVTWPPSGKLSIAALRTVYGKATK